MTKPTKPSLESLKINSPTTRVKGFDCDAPLSATQAAHAYEQGYRFCLRYLSLEKGQRQGDLSKAEARGLLGAGLAIMAVQHVNFSGWRPTQSLGTKHGNHAVFNAQSVELPAGINLWCDLEGVSSTSPAQDVIDYVQAWHQAVKAASYVPGLYVGPSPGLSGSQLYKKLSMQHYWKAGASSVPEVSERGYQMFQNGHDHIDGIKVDVDHVCVDHLGGQVLWLAPS